jgi:tetratricopeptide (TPR) repeat protein
MLNKAQDDDLVISLVDLALTHPTGQREAYLRNACGDDTELFDQTWSYVQWEQRMNGFLLDPLYPAASYEHPFEPGELLDDRFRIVREIAQGGMGIVYEAVDEKLQRRIALKCAKTGFRKRLPPEVRNATEISHPNVCKIFEIHTASTRQGEIDFITMEFLDGETLADRLTRGPLPEKEARAIALQLSAGLAEAHRNRVIHGDLKSNNVILTTGPHGAVRAVITDFGLASGPEAALATAPSGQMAGTPDYMAPELWKGAKASVTSDIYALGVIFHVMLTGEAPSRQSTLPEFPQELGTLTVNDVRQKVNRPRASRELPSPWDEIVECCLELQPEKRFVSVEALIDRLDATGRVSMWLRRAAAVAAILTVLFWVGRPPAIRLAVLPFEVTGGPIQTAGGLALDIADRLQGLRRGLVLIPPQEAQRTKVDSFEKARSILAATHVLSTRLNNSGRQIEILASVVDTESGRTLRELKGTYSANDTTLVAKALMATVTGTFHLRNGVPMELVSPAAYPSYIQGINLVRRDQVSADEAIPFFHKAIELDPSSALTYAGLAEAQVQKFQRGYGYQWLDFAAQSVAKAQSLNPDCAPVLLAAGLFKQQRGWYEQAAQDFSRAVELTPYNGEAWNRLANAYSSMNRTDEAIATYQKAIQTQPDYYAPYIDFGLFYYFQGQFRQAEQLFRRASEIAPGLAKAHMDLGVALKEQSRFQEAERSLLTALRLQETSQVLTNLGALYYQEERFVEAARYFEKSLNPEPPNALQYYDLGETYRHLGLVPEAIATYRRGLLLAESDVAQNPREPFPRGRLALLFALLGERHRAEFEIAQALSMGAGNFRVLRYAAFMFETLGEREKTLQVLGNAPQGLLDELSIQPDMKDLQRDRRFQELRRNKAAEK